MSVDIEKMSVEELIAHRSEVDARIKHLQSQKRKELLDSVRSQAHALGVSVEDLAAALLGRAPKARDEDAEDGRKKPVPPKYRDVHTGETWSGRGRKPKWYEAALSSGMTEEDLLIK